MKIKCDYCKRFTFSEEEIIDALKDAYIQAKATGKVVETGLSCIGCDAPVITITVNAEAGILEDE